MNRPTFFLSSTIYDFKDLRSSIKFYLEEQGFSVFASEFTDFPKPLNFHSYDACLETIAKSDYFVLLLGSRIGGWYDKPNRISITQKEYRTAYELHKRGKLKIIALVRRELWQFRDQRKELAKQLEVLGVEATTANAIKVAPTKYAEDAEFICKFIDEISRNAETKAAVDNGNERPTGNWIHTFETFRDAIDAIRSESVMDTPLQVVALKRLLAREIRQNLKSSLVKSNNGPALSPLNTIRRFHQEHDLTISDRDNLYTRVETKRWESISYFSIHLIALDLKSHILDRALESSAFLRFSVESKTFIEEPVYEALHRLQQLIKHFQKIDTSETIKVVLENTRKYKDHSRSHIEIESFKLLALLSSLDRWANIIQLSGAILKYLNGEPFQMPSLQSKSPIKEMIAELDKEEVTDQDIEKFLADQF